MPLTYFDHQKLCSHTCNVNFLSLVTNCYHFLSVVQKLNDRSKYQVYKSWYFGKGPFHGMLTTT